MLIHEHEKRWHESKQISLKEPEAQSLAQSEHEDGISSHLPLEDSKCEVHDRSEDEITFAKMKLQFMIIDGKKYRL